jgi:methylphosphotriester-DNA--protein-cysteine methyltransferase
MIYAGISDRRLLTGLIRNGLIRFAGNKKMKIYGTLSCSSGKRMKPQHRVFFKSKTEALQFGYRPCAHCMNQEFKHWKNGTNRD